MSERPGSRWLAPVATATGVALVVAGVLLAVGRGSEPGERARAGSDLLVRNGDEVVAKGVVVATPGRPVLFCPPYPHADTGTGPRAEPVPYCLEDPRAIVVTGVDLGRLSRAGVSEDTTYGYAELRGAWRDRTIAVTGQRPFTEEKVVPTPDVEPPCPRPPGDWKSADPDPLVAYVARQPDRFGTESVAYVDGKEVFVIGVVEGDLDEARRELDPLYDGNLCVVRAKQSITKRKQVHAKLQALWTDHPEAVVATAEISADGQPWVEVLVLDQTTHDVLARIGWDQFGVDAVIRPA